MGPAPMTTTIKTCVGLATVTLAFVMSAQADVMKELAPTGKLRVAIAVAPAPSALYAIKDDATGQYRGVTVELASAMARKLGVPVEFLPHLASGEIQDSAASGKWDVTFMPVDEERKKFVDFGNAYHLLQSTYLVAPGARLANVDDANAPGVRIGGVANTATFRGRAADRPESHIRRCAGRGRCSRCHEGRGNRLHRAVARISLRPRSENPRLTYP